MADPRRRRAFPRKLIKASLRDDPDVRKAVDALISTLRARAIVPTHLTVLHHCLHLEAMDEGRAHLFAELVERRLEDERRAVRTG